jgi:aminoglycoside phosphotransferase (APT) family kinase protein
LRREGVVGFDIDAVTRWIVDLGLGARPPLSFARIGAGRSNLTFEVHDSEGARWVLRRPPLGHRLASAHDVGREYHVLSRLAETPVPAPAGIALCTDRAIADAPLLLMEHCGGGVIDDDAARSLTPATRHAIGIALPDALVGIHAVDLEAAGLADFASHAPYAARQLKRWRRQSEAARTRDLPQIDELAVRLGRAAPQQREVVLVHGDFHLHNLLFDTETSEIKAILDWELCTLGEPLADLGSLLAYWPEPGEPLATGPFAVTTLPGFPTRAELTHAYRERSGSDLTALPFWEALACWKVAVIAVGVLRRRRDEPTNTAAPADDRFDDALVEAMLARAALIADQAGI